MGRLTLIFTALIIVSFPSLAKDVINIDWKTIGQVEINTAAQVATEELHTIQVDSIKTKQEKLAGLIGTLATYKGLALLTYENAKGFGMESGIYKSIVATCVSIASRSKTATEAVMNTNFTGKAISAFQIYELTVEAGHLCNLFFNIVTNATVPNPMKLPGADDTKDKLNLLNRHERLSMALKINAELKKIDRKLITIEWFCKHNSVENLLRHFDRNTWVTYVYSQISAKRLIERWNGLTE